MAASNNHRLTVTVKPNSGHTLFRYTAKDIDGKVVRGAMEAADYDTLYTQLLAQGLYLQSATRRGAGRKPRTLRPQELSDLCRQLSTLLASGVSLVRALTIISQDEGISAGLRRIYESVLGEVRKGSSLSAALEAQQVFPPLMLGMIRAGEGSGKLDQVAERLAIHYEKAHQMNQQVKSALMYPMILAILAVVVVIVIVTFVLPQFSDLFSTMDSLPGVTLALMAFSNFDGYQMVSDDTGCRGSGHGYPHAAAHSGRPAGNGPAQAQNAGFRSAQSGYLHGAVRANRSAACTRAVCDRYCAADRP